MNDDTIPAAPLPELLRKSAASLEISTEPDDAEVLLAGEAARHFPEPRNRRREDAEDEHYLRLRSILEALDKGNPYPDAVEEDRNAPVHSQFYKQF